MNDGCYDLDGNPLSIGEWLTYTMKVHEDPAQPWRVAYDEFEEFTVSTIWTGTDMHFDDEPLIFETMVFDGAEPGLQIRWATRAQAREGHALFVRILTDPAGRQTYREQFTGD